MGDQRYEELMQHLRLAFAQADDGEEKRRMAREREQQHEQWLIAREATLREINKLMREYDLTPEDLA